MSYRVKIINNINPRELGLPAGYVIGANVENPQAIAVRSDNVNICDYSEELLAVARAGVGVNNISIKDATENGICIFNTPGANANAVAERVLAALFEVSRNIREVRRFMATLQDINDDNELTNAIERRKSEFKGFELTGKVLGIIGLGRVGGLVANKAVALGMKVIGYDPYPTNENMHRLDTAVSVVQSLLAVVSLSDMITVHVPYLKETKHIINKEVLKKMKTGVVLLNYSRGGIYDDDAVCDALDNGKVLKYVTDFPTARLIKRKDVTCTPHLGANTEESEEKCALMAGTELKNYLEYGVVENSVNFPSVDMFPAPSTSTRCVIINKNVPDMIAQITSVLGRKNINIAAEINKSREIGYTLIDLEVDISPEIIEAIRLIKGVIRVRVITF